MTLLERHKEAFSKNPKNEDLLVAELNTAFHDLDGETEGRIQRYRLYNNFFHGNQWFRLNRKPDRHKYTVNMCEPIVSKYASLLMGDAPTIIIPNESETDPINDVGGYQGFGEEVPDFEAELNRSDLLEKALHKIVYIDNPGEKIFYEGAKAGSLYGDTVLYADYDEKKNSFKLQNIFPGYVRAQFATDDYTETDYVILQHIVTKAYIWRKYGVEVSADESDDLAGTDLVWNSRKFTLRDDYVLLKTYYDDEVKVVYAGDKILERKEHKYGRVPFWVIPNRQDPYNPWGISDLADIIQPQERLNIAVSNQADIIELFANPKIIGRNITQRDIEGIKKAQGSNIIPLRRDADLQPFQFTGQIFPIQQEIADARQAIYDVSGLPPVFFGTAQGSIVTGVALNAQAAPTLQIVNAKSLIWKPIIENMLSFMLRTLDKRGAKIEIGKGKKYKLSDVINEEYRALIQTNIRTPKDDAVYSQNEMNKLNFRVQSRTTTMKNLGVKFPDDELKKIAWEELNPLYTNNPDRLLNDQLHVPQNLSEEAQVAFDENERMLAGEEVPVTTKGPEANKLHLEVHEQFVKSNNLTEPDPATGQPNPAVQIFDAHMAEHERLASEGGNTLNIPGASKNKGETNFPTATPETANEIANPSIPSGGAGETVPLPPGAING